MYTNGGQDTPMVGDGYGANAGVTYAGFSIDGYYTKENGAVNLKSFAYAAGAVTATTCDASLGNCPNYLLGTITNNEAWDVMAKYSSSVPSFFSEPALSMKDAPCGGLKDAPCAPSSATVTIFGGYQYVDQSNPDHPQAYYSGFTTIGGYRYVTTTNPATEAFGSDRIRETAWAGVSYLDGPWRLAGAWYYFSQNSYLSNATGSTSGLANNTCAGATAKNRGANGFVGNPVGANCSGDYNQGSFLIDYTVNRHFDVYAGVTFADQTGGLNSGYLADNSWAFASGVRIKW